MVLFNKLLFGNRDFKYFIAFRDFEKLRPLFIFLPQMIIYKKNFGENKRTYFSVK